MPVSPWRQQVAHAMGDIKDTSNIATVEMEKKPRMVQRELYNYRRRKINGTLVSQNNAMGATCGLAK